CRLTEHHWDNRRLAMANVEAEVAHFLLEKLGIRPQALDQFVRRFEHIHRFEAGCYIRHSHGAGKQERATTLFQPVDNHLLASNDATDHAKRLAHRADFNIDLAMQIKVIDDAASTTTEYPFAMCVIDHEQNVVFFC